MHRLSHLALLTSVSVAAFAGKPKGDPAPDLIGNGITDPAPAPATTDATTVAAKGERVAPVLTGPFVLELPTKTTNKRGSKSAYDFASLEVGAAFGVKNKTKVQMASVVTNANKKYVEPKRDGNGAIVYKQAEMRDAAGNVTGMAPTSEAETIVTRHFIAVDVTDEIAKLIAGTPLEGSTVLIQRDK